MTATAHSPASFELRTSHSALWPTPAQEAPRGQLSIRASDDGWSLLDSRGVVLFRGLGLRSRRRCLELAREMGVLVVRN